MLVKTDYLTRGEEYNPKMIGSELLKCQLVQNETLQIFLLLTFARY
jgi:hypothetical protein